MTGELVKEVFPKTEELVFDRKIAHGL